MGLSALTVSNTADLLNRTCTKIDYRFPCPVYNFLSPRPILRSAGRSITDNIRPWKWEMSCQSFEPQSTSLYGCQIDANFTFTAKGRQASGSNASRPFPENPTAAAPVSLAPSITWLPSRYATRLTHTAKFLIQSRALPVHSAICSTANLEKIKLIMDPTYRASVLLI